MRKVAIIPLLYKSYNYGGTLQYYALEKAITDLGFETYVLNIDKYGEKIFQKSEAPKSKRTFFARVIHKILWEYCEYISKKEKINFNIRNERFDKFRIDNVNCFCPNSLDEIDSSFFAFVAGSDQIWNPQWAKTTYFLDFVHQSKKIIYGASVGRKELSEIQKQIYSNLLNHVDSVSVRETDISEQLQMFYHKSINTVIDPVFLIESKQWNKLIKKNYKFDKGYCFCYLIGDEPKYRKELKKKKDEYIVSIPYVTQKYIFNENYANEMILEAGPSDFLELILNAKYVITDSFHATAFSIIFHKQFFVLNRELGNSQMLSRITTLLEYFHLENHLVDSIDDLPKDIPDWEKIDLKISELRKNSIEFLLESLN